MIPVGRTEVIPFSSFTMQDTEFLRAETGTPAKIAGVLRVPATGQGRVPLVILLHGSGGPITYVDAWALRLHQWGWATFLVDSFSGRGIQSVRDQQGELGRLVGVLDAYRALEKMSTHPLVDPERIVLMGFSRGGQAALYSAMRRFQKRHLGRQFKFAGHIAFYPNCCFQYLEDEDLAEAPVLIHHGEADDFNPMDASREYVQRLQVRGHRVDLVTHAGAHHVFDWHGFTKPVHAPEAQSLRACRVIETAPGHLTFQRSGRPFSYLDPEVEKGTTAAYHPKAAVSAFKSVGVWLQAYSMPMSLPTVV